MTDLGTWREDEPEYYEPAEDSLLLADTCAERIDATDVVVDVGTGSGVVADRIRSRRGATVYGVDLNPHACRRAAERGLPIIRGDLLSGVRTNAADVIVCNPPYLPTPAEERQGDWRAVAVSGGSTGRVVVEDLLADAGRVLRDDGECFLLTSSLMGVEEVAAEAERRGFSMRELARNDDFPFEVLAVQHLVRDGA